MEGSGPPISSEYTNFPAEPVLHPIWRGSFNTNCKSLGKVDGLVAHPSNKACMKALRFAGLLPELIHLELLPKSDVWPRSFDCSLLSDENIALFFFADSDGSQENFDTLVERMICQSLAMRTVAESAELLIFTSIDLPLPFWRFQGKHYLWGLFIGKSAWLPSQGSLSLDIQTSSKNAEERKEDKIIDIQCHLLLDTILNMEDEYKIDEEQRQKGTTGDKGFMENTVITTNCLAKTQVSSGSINQVQDHAEDKVGVQDRSEEAIEERLGEKNGSKDSTCKEKMIGRVANAAVNNLDASLQEDMINAMSGTLMTAEVNRVNNVASSRDIPELPKLSAATRKTPKDASVTSTPDTIGPAIASATMRPPDGQGTTSGTLHTEVP